MTDINTGSYSISAHNLPKDMSAGKKNCDCDADKTQEKAPDKETNLNNSSAAIAGKAMVKTTAPKSKGEYQFDSKNVEDDVKYFQEQFDIAYDAIVDYKKGLIEQGYEETAAQEKAAQFAACLIANQNV